MGRGHGREDGRVLKINSTFSTVLTEVCTHVMTIKYHPELTLSELMG